MSAGTILLALFAFAGALHLLFGGVLAPTATDEMQIALVAFVQFSEASDPWLLGSVIASRRHDRPDEAGGIDPSLTFSASAPAICSADAPPLFQQPWWLDAVAPGSWDAVEIVENGEIVGRLPFVRLRRFGLTILGQPPLTQFLGPWVKPGIGEVDARLDREDEILAGLIEALPPHDVFFQACRYSMTNCHAFHARGFSHANQYTYVIDELDDHDRIWAGFRENVRREIRKAQRVVGVRSLEDIETLIALNRMTFERQGMSPAASEDVIRRLDAACKARGARRMLVAEGADGAPHAALYLVWDAESAYYLMGGGDPSLRTSGAMSLLMWEAIKFAGQVTRRFDFEGSMLRPV
ncbi:MAG TPA: GNAT family N-acetyltransferase, partial [Dehalococcoidia bacterium]|nr:GNAT family N-acetyltransferase [Dehalococcoidia bacterium]